MMKQAELKDRLKAALDLCDKKAIDLSNDLKIPKSAISQYLSGKTKKMDASRIYSIAKYLDVDETWLMGYDVPMERIQKERQSTGNDELSKDMKALIDFAKSVPEDKAELVLRVMKSIVEGEK